METTPKLEKYSDDLKSFRWLIFLFVFMISCESDEQVFNKCAIDHNEENLVNYSYIDILYCDAINTEDLLIIKDSSDYKNIFGDCDTKPEFNLIDYYYIGKYGSVSGCSITYDRYVERKDSTLIYYIYMIREGACKQIGYNFNFIELPREHFTTVELHIETCYK